MLRADKIYDVIYQLSQERRFSGKRFIPKQTFEFLRGKRGEVVSASTVDRIFKKEFHHFWNKTLTKRDRNLVLKEAGPRSSNQLPLDPGCFLYNVRSGRDCGCCDNYPGPCILCSWICYSHDIACIDCTPDWFCGPDCIPGCPNIYHTK